jgi:hypothetical protein
VADINIPEGAFSAGISKHRFSKMRFPGNRPDPIFRILLNASPYLVRNDDFRGFFAVVGVGHGQKYIFGTP